jgi:hypothetical protein
MSQHDPNLIPEHDNTTLNSNLQRTTSLVIDYGRALLRFLLDEQTVMIKPV